MQRNSFSVSALHYWAILIAASAVLFSCNDPFPGIVYRFKTGDICSCGGPAEYVVYASDEFGNILDVRTYTSNQTTELVTFNKTLPARINLTYVRYSTVGSFTTINTELGVLTKRTLDPETTPAKFDESTGFLNVTVNNYSGNPTEYYNGFIIGAGDPRFYPSTLTNNTLTSGINIYKGIETILMTANINGNWVYFGKDISEDKSPITLDLNVDFKPMQHSLTLDYPQSSGTIVGYKRSKAQPTKTFSFDQSRKSGLPNEPSPFRLGYNDGYDYYLTRVSTSSNNTFQDYYKVGSPPPATIPFLNYTFEVTNGDINDFRFTLSGLYTSRRTTWSVNETGSYISWSINSPADGRQTLQKVYDDIKKRYPSLNLEKMIHSYSSFDYTGSTGPIDYDLLRNPPANTIPKYETLSIRFGPVQ